jgi:hypothetical protein
MSAHANAFMTDDEVIDHLTDGYGAADASPVVQVADQASKKRKKPEEEPVSTPILHSFSRH